MEQSHLFTKLTGVFKNYDFKSEVGSQAVQSYIASSLWEIPACTIGNIVVIRIHSRDFPQSI